MTRDEMLSDLELRVKELEARLDRKEKETSANLFWAPVYVDGAAVWSVSGDSRVTV